MTSDDSVKTIKACDRPAQRDAANPAVGQHNERTYKQRSEAAAQKISGIGQGQHARAAHHRKIIQHDEQERGRHDRHRNHEIVRG